MDKIVYAMCGLTSLTCAVLLIRGYLGTRSRLLLWSGLCFCGLALSNTFLYVDLVMVPDTDLAIPRHLMTLGSVSILLGGLIWESR